MRPLALFAVCLYCLTALVMSTALKKVDLELYYAPQCVEGLWQLPETYCHGPDKQHLVCPHIGMNLKKGCEVMRIVK